MSSYNPPIYYFSGIGFNSAFYTFMTTGLTQSQANALYLQKTTPDTATAVETFSSGILTTSVDVPTSSSGINIGVGSTSGTINIGTASVRTGGINIGNGSSVASGANTNINNGTPNASNTNIMNNSTTSGSCNIMTGSTSTGIVNIATGTGSSVVNISNGTTTGAVNIGNLTNAVTISSSSLTLGTPFKTLTVQVPISLNYDPSIISSNTLGYLITGTGSTSSVTSVPTTIRQLTLTFGVWLLISNVYYSTPGTYYQLSISVTNNGIDSSYASINTGVPGAVAQVTRIVNTTTSGFGPWYLVGGCSVSSAISNIVFTATRIA